MKERERRNERGSVRGMSFRRMKMKEKEGMN